ncbi:hypothetical protein BDF21DRAFT_459416 [Thamnidium elegans]|nr:hypothetical protein BDF21DRAFT_459416 [Thamnidium elegans]
MGSTGSSSSSRSRTRNRSSIFHRSAGSRQLEANANRRHSERERVRTAAWRSQLSTIPEGSIASSRRDSGYSSSSQQYEQIV